jgi:hypothetical protein
MGDWSLGSFAELINKKIDNLDPDISGTLLEQINQVIIDVENATGDSIGSVAIAPKFQPTILNLSLACTYMEQNAIGTDADSVRLGEFQVKKGGDSNLVKNAEFFEKRGMKQLNNLGYVVNTFQTFFD